MALVYVLCVVRFSVVADLTLLIGNCHTILSVNIIIVSIKYSCKTVVLRMSGLSGEVLQMYSIVAPAQQKAQGVYRSVI